MVKINEVLTYKGEKYKRISLATVKKLIKNNGSINLFLIPNNGNIYSPWISFINKEANSDNLEKIINETYYYICNSELGNRLHYYILEEQSGDVIFKAGDKVKLFNGQSGEVVKRYNNTNYYDVYVYYEDKIYKMFKNDIKKIS